MEGLRRDKNVWKRCCGEWDSDSFREVSKDCLATGMARQRLHNRSLCRPSQHGLVIFSTFVQWLVSRTKGSRYWEQSGVGFGRTRYSGEEGSVKLNCFINRARWGSSSVASAWERTEGWRYRKSYSLSSPLLVYYHSCLLVSNLNLRLNSWLH